MKKSIKSGVKELCGAIHLSPAELDVLRDAEYRYIDCKNEQYGASKVEKKNTIAKKIWFGQFRYMAAVASVFLVVISIWIIVPNTDKTEQVFIDAVENHFSYKKLNYREKTLSELTSNFNYLGFMLMKSQPMMKVQGVLIGARPCLILSIPAAQLRYKLNNDQWVTVFQARYEKRIHGLVPDINNHHQPLVKSTNGVQVSVWQDSGLLFAMVQP